MNFFKIGSPSSNSPYSSSPNFLKSLKSKKWINITYVKYILSYLAILTILCLGFFFILRNQLAEKYFEQQLEQSMAQLDKLAEGINEDFLSLQQIDRSLQDNIDLIISNYLPESASSRRAYSELNQYNTASRLINSIVFLPKSSSKPITSNIMASYQDDCFYLRNNIKQANVAFDPSPYLDTNTRHLIYLSSEDQEYLIYFPILSSQHNYIYFYILDTDIFRQQFLKLNTKEMPAIALLDADGQFAVEVNASQLEPYMTSLPTKSGIYHMDSSTSLCVNKNLKFGFSMVALLSNSLILNQISSAFASSYLALLLLCIAGLLLILFAMRITYIPLHKLTQKVVPEPDSRQGYLQQLDEIYFQSNNQIQTLKHKLDNYRLSIEKSLLDSMVFSHNSKKADSTTLLPEIDQLFDSDPNREIFIVHVMSSSETTPSCWDNVLEYYQNVLPGTDICMILETKEDSAIFLINYIGTEKNKEEKMRQLCSTLYEELGYKTAISNSSNSPLDIPSLYENVLYTSSYWTESPVVEFSSLPTISTAYSYPYDHLNRLSKLLETNDFSGARDVIDDLFKMIHTTIVHASSQNNLSDFYMHAILVDMLTTIINYMNLSYINFHSYSDLYFETLYFCRSCPYAEKSEEIKANIGKLIDFCEESISKKLLSSPEFLQILEEFYCQPDFSISILADKLHVNYYYMSQLFKKEMKVSFSDYVWTMRLKKAKELLRTTNMPIDDISAAIGYLNSSSFRRKFKQETGMTPSQFRERKGK